jgi:hypothetical protein
MKRTDITLVQWINNIAKKVPESPRSYIGYKGIDGAYKLADDIGYAFLNFPKKQWNEGLETSWKIAKAVYGKKIPIHRSNWNAAIERKLPRYPPLLYLSGHQ